TFGSIGLGADGNRVWNLGSPSLLPQVLEDPGIDPARTGPPLLEVLPPHVVLQRLPQLFVRAQLPQGGERSTDLALQRRVDSDQVLLTRMLEVQPVQIQERRQLLDGALVVVDPEI